MANTPPTQRVQAQERAAQDVQIRTFLIADVRGYTLFTQERGDEAAAKLAAKFADIAREVVEARGGILLELRGDEALCVFSSAREAIRAAVDLQQRFVEETLDQPELPLTVGIGLDAGEAVAVQGGYRGGALNLAARLCGQARAGEILASREVTHLARRIDGVRYEDRGPLTFKGISDPVAVVRVVPEGGDAVERLRPFAPRRRRRRRRRGGRWVLVGGSSSVLALVAISIPLLTSATRPTSTIGTNSVARLNAEDGSVELATELGQRPGASAIGFGSLWVAEPDRGVVARLDLDDGSVTDTIPVGNVALRHRGRRGLGLGDERGRRHGEPDHVETNEVSQTTPRRHRRRPGSRSATAPCGSPTGRRRAAADRSRSPGSRRGRRSPACRPASPSRPTACGSRSRRAASRASTRRAERDLTQRSAAGRRRSSSTFGSIWVANHLDGTVTRLEPSTGRVEATIPVGEGPNALGCGRRVAVGRERARGHLVAIDPATNSVEQTVPSGRGGVARGRRRGPVAGRRAPRRPSTAAGR